MENVDFSTNIYELILTYAIDKQNDDRNQMSFLKDIGLTNEYFLKDIYVPRESEQEIINHLQTSHQPMLVIGFPGTGKTSVVTKSLFHLRGTFDGEPEVVPNYYLIKFDFKNDENISEYKNDIDIRQWHEKELRKKILLKLQNDGIDDYKVICFLFEDKNNKYEASALFQEISRELYNAFRLDESIMSFHDWFIDSLKKRYPFVVEQANKLTKCIRNRDYLFFIVNNYPSKINGCILFYDNLDSITYNEVRDAFHIFIRDYSGIVSHYTNIIITARSSSISDQTLSDYGAHNWKKIFINYDEFISKNIYNARIEEIEKAKGFCSEWDKLVLKNNLTYHSKENFAKTIIARRTEFINKITSNDKYKSVTTSSKIKQLKEFYDLIIYNQHIHTAMLDLSNNDRHTMFKILCEFGGYILRTLKIDVDSLGDSEEERKFILESYFYHWIIDNPRLETNFYDIVKDTKLWYDKDHSLGCSFTHIIFAALYNLTNKQRGQYDYINKVTIKELIIKIEKLGYNPNVIMEKIFSLYKYEEKYLGMLESTKFFKIKTKDSFMPDDNIWITPRTAYMCDYLIYKFLYSIALLRYNKFTLQDGSIFDYDDKNPITYATISGNIYFLCQMAYSHYTALLDMKSNLLVHHKINNWFVYYKKWFCIKSHNSIDKLKKGDGNYGELLFQNVIRSHILFLEHQRTIIDYYYISTKMIDQYKKLETYYDALVDKICNDDEIYPNIKLEDIVSEINFNIFNNMQKNKGNLMNN